MRIHEFYFYNAIVLMLASSTGQMMNLFANLEVRNDSTSSLSHELSDPRNISVQGDMPISRSSELALALMPVSSNLWLCYTSLF